MFKSMVCVVRVVAYSKGSDWISRRGLKPGFQEAEALSILEAEAEVRDEALVMKPKSLYLSRNQGISK